MARVYHWKCSCSCTSLCRFCPIVAFGAVDADVVMLVGRLMDVVEKTGGKMPHVVAMVHDEGTGDTLAGMMEGAGMEASLDVVEPSSLSSAMLAQVTLPAGNAQRQRAA